MINLNKQIDDARAEIAERFDEAGLTDNEWFLDKLQSLAIAFESFDQLVDQLQDMVEEKEEQHGQSKAA